MPNLNGTNGDDNIEVNSGTGTVNGGPGVSPVDNINARGGEDTVSVDDSTVDGNLNAGGGDDIVEVSNDSTIEGNLLGGGGDDTISVDDSTVEGNIVAASGEDVVTVSNNSTVDGNIEGASNSDYIFVDESTVDGNIVAASGNDTVGIVDSTINGNVGGGGGNDTLLLPVGTEVVDDDEGSFTITSGFNGPLSSGTATLPSGQVIEYINFEQGGVTCFTPTSLISTSEGPVPAGELVPGDLVLTLDNGFQEIRWVGSRTLGKGQLAMSPNLQPVRIRAGALGKGLPQRDLVVSPQHRMLVNSNVARNMFGEQEVLVAAKQLTSLEGVDIAHDLNEVTYVHFLCNTHEIVFAEGGPSESLYTGKEALKAVGPKARAEIFALFPELKDRDPRALSPSARPLIKGKKVRNMVRRMKKNQRMPLERSVAVKASVAAE